MTEQANLTDIMLDIETFGTGNNAAIVSIGAVAFNADGDNAELFTNSPEVLERGGLGFHGRVDLAATARAMRGNLDPETVEWWLTQSDAARQALLTGERKPLGTVLGGFSAWIKSIAGRPRALRLWSNGPTFDETIVRAAYERYALELPLSFRGSRCCRTMFELAKMYGWDHKAARAGVPDDVLKHDALGDAVFQARGLVLQREHLRERLAVRTAMREGGGL